MQDLEELYGEQIEMKEVEHVKRKYTKHKKEAYTPEAITEMKAARIRILMTGMVDMFIAKNSDYGDSFAESLRDFGISAGVIRIGDKYNRIKSLTKKGRQLVRSESVRDTLLDMATYCIMTVMEMDLLIDEVEIV